MQTVYRRADTVQILPVLEFTVRCVAALSALEKADRAFTAQALRGAELRVHQRAADRVNHLREYGQEKDDGYHGHGAVARGHVQTKGVGDIAKERHEIPALPVDMLREGASRLYGVRHGV